MTADFVRHATEQPEHWPVQSQKQYDWNGETISIEIKIVGNCVKDSLVPPIINDPHSKDIRQ